MFLKSQKIPSERPEIVVDISPDNLIDGKFVCIRRSNDISQTGSFVPAPTVNDHGHPAYGTHHAEMQLGCLKQ